MKTFNIVRTFFIDLDGEPLKVEAEIRHAAYTILHVTDHDGCTVFVDADNLDEIERAIDRALYPETVSVNAADPESGLSDTFTVHHDGDNVGPIFRSGGSQIPYSSPVYTEVAECFAIDRRWAMVEESDVQGYARRAYGW